MAVSLLAFAGCGDQTPKSASPSEGPAATTTEPRPLDAFCEKLTSSPLGTIASDSLVETSGAEWANDLLWLHNDSNQALAVYGVDLDGITKAVLSISHPDIDEGTDVEDITVLGNTIYLADVGNNLGTDDRNWGRVYEFEIPTKLSGPTTKITDVTVHTIVFPDERLDIEAFMVDPLTNEFYFVEKTTNIISLLTGHGFDARVYSSDLESGEARLRGTVPMAELSTTATNPEPTGSVKTLGSLVTGADISDDGAIVALRTYQSVWLFPRQNGELIPDALRNTPCEAPVAAETQGEAVAFLGDPTKFVTVSEGLHPSINITEPG